ncbi:hypothetical protein [Patulibacter minatonensis]|uniref:hypothetical protein n=1 Tax=Patulibacter minatonensis TaxID=298163 RepID=UPI00047ED4D6|nr:hypothetical protein [Patulibacter minatonensis]
MIERRPPTGLSTAPPVRRRLARVAVAIAGTVALTAPGAASAASAPCPRTGSTLATSRTDDGSSRIWRTHGRTYGCTTIGNASGRPDTRLLSRRPVGRIRLDGQTAAWTQHATGTPARARRVSAIDLTSGARFLDRRKALPAEDAEGSRDREGSVDQLRVLRGNVVGWIADGSTVVIGVDDPDDVGIAGEDEATGAIYLSGSGTADGYAGVARRYPSTPAGDRSLRTSLSIATEENIDDDDEGRYRTTWSWSPDGTTTVRAEMTGTH